MSGKFDENYLEFAIIVIIIMLLEYPDLIYPRIKHPFRISLVLYFRLQKSTGRISLMLPKG
jgi:hypothetical protein